MSTHGCFAPPFPPFFSFSVDATRCRSPGARCHRRCLLLRGDRRRPGVVRRLPGRRPCLFDRNCFCASLLKANLSNLCLYSDIVASADSCVFKLMYSSPRGPWLVI